MTLLSIVLSWSFLSTLSNGDGTGEVEQSGVRERVAAQSTKTTTTTTISIGQLLCGSVQFLSVRKNSPHSRNKNNEGAGLKRSHGLVSNDPNKNRVLGKVFWQKPQKTNSTS